MRASLRWVPIVALLASTALPSQTFAWGEVGHEIICQIAYQELDEATRAKLDAILAADASAKGLKTKSFAVSCLYPDKPTRRRAPEHFLNLDRTADSVTTPGCGANPTCVLSAIAADVAILKDTTRTKVDRKVALAFLGHWVGDLHQPLHISFADDRGGNELRAKGLCAKPEYGSTSLHSVWDACLVHQPRGILKSALTNGPKIAMIRSEAKKLRQDITDESRTSWLSTSPVEWANESFQISEQMTTQYCLKPPAGGPCAYASDNATFDIGETKRSVTASQGYINANARIVDDRLRRAGVRLAKLITEALAP